MIGSRAVVARACSPHRCMKLSNELFDHLTRSIGDEASGEFEGEHRGDPRLGLVGRGVIIPCPARCGRRPVSVAVRDLSAAGIGIIHTHRLEQREQFILRIPAVPGVLSASAVLCTVAHCRPVGLGIYMIGAHYAGLIDPAHAPTTNKPVPLQVESMVTAFRQQAVDGLSEEEAEQLRQVEARLSGLQTQ